MSSALDTKSLGMMPPAIIIYILLDTRRNKFNFNLFTKIQHDCRIDDYIQNNTAE